MVVGSLTDPDAVRRAMRDVATLIHLAATPDDDDFLARIDVLSRRGPALSAETKLCVGDLDIDLLGQQVRRQGAVIDLTAREYRILTYLARNQGRVVTRSMLLEHVWDYHFDPQTNIIDQHVSRLRQKLDRGFETSLIETVRGAGYAIRRSG